MITLLDMEVQRLKKLGINHNLVRTCHRYYMPNDDWAAMRVVAAIRGYDDPSDFYRYCVEGMNYR